ncbi:MAG: stalk domain-containing protein [Firmicutes bacterium]|nr:stalk domain-containing protein [Bacillota bacterium]
MRTAFKSAATAALVLSLLVAATVACAATPGSGPAEKKHRFIETADEMDAEEQLREEARHRVRVRNWEGLEVRLRERLEAIERLADQGELDEAIEEAEQCADENPDEPEVEEYVRELRERKEKKQLHERVKALLRLAVSDSAGALEQLKAFLVEHPGNAEALRAIAGIEEERGRFKEAAEALEGAVESDPRNQTLYGNLKRVYAAMGDRSPKVFVNGKRPAFDVPPVIVSGKTVVPIRAIASALGAAIEWREETREIVISKGETTIVLQLENRVAVVNGQEMQLDVPPRSVNGRALVPLRFVGEALHCDVGYDDASGVITVADSVQE